MLKGDIDEKGLVLKSAAPMCRAQSLFLALGALVRPGVNFLAHCRNFRRRVKNFSAQLQILGAPTPKE